MGSVWLDGKLKDWFRISPWKPRLLFQALHYLPLFMHLVQIHGHGLRAL